MIVVMNRLSAPAAFGGRIEEGFAHAGGRMTEVPGCLGFRLLRLTPSAEPSAVTGDDGTVPAPVTSDSVLYIAETTWQDEASYQAWMQSDAFSRAHGAPGGGPGGASSPLTAVLERFDILNGAAT